MKTLHIVATPIGNLNDLSPAMIGALSNCQMLLCESLSAAKRLCSHAGVSTPKLVRYWQKTEKHVVDLISASEATNIVLISDAGTPCISDPGYVLVNYFHEMGWQVRAVPGPCAAISALSISGMPTDQFSFYGFLPPKSAARVKALEKIKQGSPTWVIYESPRRILAFCEDVAAVFGDDYTVCVVKEITKVHERVIKGRVRDVINSLAQVQKGEFVFIGSPSEVQNDWCELAGALAQVLPPSQASQVVAKLMKVSKSAVYKYLAKTKNS